MALLKEVLDGSNQSWNYHKVVNINVNTYDNTMSFFVDSYKDTEARHLYNPMRLNCFFVFEKQYNPNEGLLSQAYNFLKNDALLDALDG